jgi:dephospho-CoA kinase
MRVYGLTGGTGSGKSAAARRFATHGIGVIDADQVGHDVLAPGGAAEQAVRDAFGNDILTDGVIDRAKLGARVFADPDALRQLNSLTHPAIFGEIGRRCADLVQAGHRVVMIDAALLAEGGQRESFLDGLVLVLAPAETRSARLVTGRGLAPEQAARQIAAQQPPEDKRPLADWIIDNDGDLAHLHRQVDAIARELVDGAV